jgi:death-on-curing protein
MSGKTIDIEQLLMLHALVLANTGGGDGIRDMGRLEAAIATQSQEVFGTELYASVYEKSAAMVRGIIADHPFVDGNKRTAMLAGLTLLKINGIAVGMSTSQLEDFAVRVAVEHLSVEDIAAWLELHSKSNKG